MYGALDATISSYHINQQCEVPDDYQSAGPKAQPSMYICLHFVDKYKWIMINLVCPIVAYVWRFYSHMCQFATLTTFININKRTLYVLLQFAVHLWKKLM